MLCCFLIFFCQVFFLCRVLHFAFGHLGWGSHGKAQVHSIDAAVWEARKWTLMEAQCPAERVVWSVLGKMEMKVLHQSLQPRLTLHTKLFLILLQVVIPHRGWVLPFPAFLSKQETIIKGDSRVWTVYIIWTDTATWKRNPCKSRERELALDIVLKKVVVKHNGDADDRMVLIHMASFGNNSMVKDYSLRLKVAEFYKSGSHQEVYSMSHPGLPEFHQLPHSQSHHSHSRHWPSSSMHSFFMHIANIIPITYSWLSHCYHSNPLTTMPASLLPIKSPFFSSPLHLYYLIPMHTNNSSNTQPTPIYLHLSLSNHHAHFLLMCMEPCMPGCPPHPCHAHPHRNPPRSLTLMHWAMHTYLSSLYVSHTHFTFWLSTLHTISSPLFHPHHSSETSSPHFHYFLHVHGVPWVRPPQAPSMLA